MDDRKRKVLLAIIQDYIATAEPIGSRTISRKYDLGVSPATIRNEMSDLEDMGFIEQPHTSAGRVPSDLGYRYYVDQLMEKQTLSQEEQNTILQGYQNRVKEVAQVIRQTGNLLSRLTSYTSLVMGPQVGNSAFKYIQMVLLEPSRALLLVVTDSGFVQNKILDIPEAITQDDLLKITQVLNEKLQGKNLADIKLTLVKELYMELANHKHLFKVIMDFIEGSTGMEKGDKVFRGGTLNMLNQPEFRDINKVKTLLSLLEQDDLLKNLLTATPEKTGVMVKIGQENHEPGIASCSMITATYQADGKVIGSIGVLGPTRMDYAKVVPIVEFMTKSLSDIFKDFYRK